MEHSKLDTFSKVAGKSGNRYDEAIVLDFSSDEEARSESKSKALNHEKSYPQEFSNRSSLIKQKAVETANDIKLNRKIKEEQVNLVSR